MIFKGRNQIAYNYGRWGMTRGGGKTWHGGADITGLDDKTVRMPLYKLHDGTSKAISGKVITVRIVTNHSNKTWEWGWYVCVKLDGNQTPDSGNYLYFCHNKSLLFRVGDKVKSGDALAIMGNSGNAALASPPIEHVHFEVRATATGRGIAPTRYMGIPNAVGVYDSGERDAGMRALYNINLRSAPGTKYAKVGTLAKGDTVGEYLEIDGTWARVARGNGCAWVCTDYMGVV